MIEPIRGTQTEPIRANQRHSDGAHQSQSKALRRSPSEPIKGTQTEPIRANQGSVAEDLLALSVPIRANQSQSEPIRANQDLLALSVHDTLRELARVRCTVGPFEDAVT